MGIFWHKGIQNKNLRVWEEVQLSKCKRHHNALPVLSRYTTAVGNSSMNGSGYAGIKLPADKSDQEYVVCQWFSAGSVNWKKLETG